MNGYIVVAFAFLAVAGATPLFFSAPAAFVPLAASSISSSTLTTAQAAALAASNTAGANAVATATSAVAATNLLVGIGLLKAVVVGGVLLHQSRGKRSADETFDILARQENAQCYHRLICDLAAGALPDNDNLLSLFDEEVSVVSAKFDFVTAAKVGKLVKRAQTCEIRYSCPLTTLDMARILA